MPDANLERDFDADHPALLSYTSGTTSQAKGVIWTHGCIFGGRETILRLDHQLEPDDVVLPYIPLFHAWAIIIFLRIVMGGSTLITQQMNTPFNKLMEALAQHRVTFLIAAPQLFHLIMKYRAKAVGWALSTARVAHTASSPLEAV